MAAAVFEKYDTNNDGTISRGEIKNALKDLGVTPTEKMLDQFLAFCDENNDGKVGREEFEYFAKAMEQVRGLQQMYAELDADGDGNISVKELCDCSYKFWKQQFTEEKAKEMLTCAEADLDQDGRVSADEFLQLMFKDRASYCGGK
ncbi:calmodulin-like protein 4 [Branchiostoma floridae]|uniref:Calmodulin-like protein 4 n=1 Tax=Branchiostoma floridae TaxID=7739 RepID=A0A9J7N783_BRAFL|nr:calmodulin-like protein 4 [Branchiostoma floridae]